MTRAICLLLATITILLMAHATALAAGATDGGQTAESVVQADPAQTTAPAPSPPGSQTGASGQAPADQQGAQGADPKKPSPPPEVRKQIERERAAAEKAGLLHRAAAANPGEVRYQVDWLNGLVDLGMDDESLSVAPALIEKFPRSAELLVGYGRALLRDGQFDLAGLQFQRAIAIDANSARAWTLSAKAASIRGEMKTAEAGFRKALSIDKNDLGARSALVQMLERLGRYAEALELLKGAGGKEGAELSGMQSLLQQFVKEPPFVLPKGFTTATVPLVVARGFPPFVKVRLTDSIERLFVIDTGSDDAKITQEAARTLGLPEKGKETYKDEEGREYLTPAYALLDQARIGDLSVRRIPVRVMPGLQYPDGQIAGSLGRDFLRRFRVVLDYAARTMTFSGAGGAPLDGSRFFETSAILVDGYRGDKLAGMFVVDSASYTPGVMDAKFVASETGLSIFSESVAKINQGPYLFKLTMPDLTVCGVGFKDFPATAVDLRSMSRQVGVNVRGVIGYSLLRLCRVEIDFTNQRIRLTRSASPAAPAGEPPAARSPAAAPSAEPGP